MSIESNISHLQSLLPAGVRLVAVSKFHPVEALREAYSAGQRIFGENRVQELAAKAPQMPADVEWHMIGHLQTNKVRQLMPHVTMIESIDSVRLLRLVDAEARRIGRTVDVLLQLHVAREETKSGFTPDELLAAATAGELEGLANVHLRGLMAMGTNTDDVAELEREFDIVRSTMERLREHLPDGGKGFDELSMGMSDDWPIAVRHGSTMVRVGSAIFGPRQY